MKANLSDEEQLAIRRERNLLQLEDAQRYRDIACQILGLKNIDDNQLFIWYCQMGYAQMFEVAWREGVSPLNLYYTGLKLGREPTRTDGWRHWTDYLERHVTIHTEPQEVTA